MNILVITQYFWPENFRINDLTEGLEQSGHKVTVLTGKPNYPSGRFYNGYGFFSKPRETYKGITVIRAPLLPRGRAGSFRLVLNYFSFAFAAAITGLISCRDKYDVIFVYAPSPITVALPALAMRWFRGVPVMLWVQDLWPESVSATGAVRSAWPLRLIGRMVRYIYKRSDRILVQSEAFRPSIERFGVKTERISYLPNSAEALFKPVVLPHDAAERAQVPSGFCIMYAGNIGAAQSFETILAAAERLKSYPDIHWVVLGDGRVAQWVRVQIVERGLTGSVHLLGRHPMEAMPRYFSLADAMLVTLKDEPIFGLTIPGRVQSYLACGRPIVAGINGEGARVVKEAGAGLTAAAEDSEGLANAVLRMYKMPRPEREAMGARGREYFLAQFEGNLLMDRLERLMKEVIEEKSACAS
jgi:colanic acid biosynthesis glycosyl transferase WcaI